MHFWMAVTVAVLCFILIKPALYHTPQQLPALPNLCWALAEYIDWFSSNHANERNWPGLKKLEIHNWYHRDKRQTQDSCKTDSTFSKDFLVSSGLKMSFRSCPANGWVHWWVMTWVSWASDFSRLWFVKVYSTLKAYTLWVQHTLNPETSNLQSLSSGAMIDWRLVSCSTVSYLRRTVGLAWDIDGYNWLWWWWSSDMVPQSLYRHLDIFYEWQGLLRGDLQIAIFLVGLGPGSWGSICSMMEPTMNSMYIYTYI